MAYHYDFSIAIKGTIVEGSTDAHMLFAGPSGFQSGILHNDCAISGTRAVCTQSLSGSDTGTALVTKTESVEFAAVTVSTVAPAVTGSLSTGSGSGTQTGASPTGSGNSAARVSGTGVVAGVLAVFTGLIGIGI